MILVIGKFIVFWWVIVYFLSSNRANLLFHLFYLMIYRLSFPLLLNHIFISITPSSLLLFHFQAYLNILFWLPITMSFLILLSLNIPKLTLLFNLLSVIFFKADWSQAYFPYGIKFTYIVFWCFVKYILLCNFKALLFDYIWKLSISSSDISENCSGRRDFCPSMCL